MFTLLRLLADVLRLEARLAAAVGAEDGDVGGRGAARDVVVARALLDVVVEHSGGGCDAWGAETAGGGDASASAGDCAAPGGTAGAGAGAGGALPEVVLAALDCLATLVSTRCASAVGPPGNSPSPPVSAHIQAHLLPPPRSAGTDAQARATLGLPWGDGSDNPEPRLPGAAGFNVDVAPRVSPTPAMLVIAENLPFFGSLLDRCGGYFLRPVVTLLAAAAPAATADHGLKGEAACAALVRVVVASLAAADPAGPHFQQVPKKKQKRTNSVPCARGGTPLPFASPTFPMLP